MFCPTRDQNRAALLALLPRGRAWRNNEGEPEPGSVIYKFWDAAAIVLTYLTDRLCALAAEMFCATHSETHELWLAEYGLPDACDPFPDLCTKVAAIGGTRCDYYQMLAARLGWTIECVQRSSQCGGMAGTNRVRSKAGRMQPGHRLLPAQLIVRVFLSESPAYIGGRSTPPRAGRFKAGHRLACPPDISGLRCLIERVVHAELQTIYQDSVHRLPLSTDSGLSINARGLTADGSITI